MLERDSLKTLAFILLFIASFPFAAGAAQPWDSPFSKDARGIIEAAGQLPLSGDSGIRMLLEDHRYRIDSKGIVTTTLRRVYLVDRKESVNTWALVEQGYQPWYEERPQLRARVITADGVSHPLDQKTIADAPADESDATMFTDQRVLRAPLPAVAVGAVVELELILRQKAPLLSAGQVRQVIFTDYFPTERVHVTIHADKVIPLKVASAGLPDGALRQSVVGGEIRAELELAAIEVPKHREFSLPPDVPQFPYLAFSTGASWQSVAGDYNQIVESKLAESGIPANLMTTFPSGPAVHIVEAITRKLHKEVRYTGVEFGESAIVPHTPAETLERKYGDCKDKSILLVAALRSVGFEAHLALLSAGFDTDVPKDLPGMGLFNHAIVHVSGAGLARELWIDATADDMPVGSIPAADQGRLALLIRPESTELVSIPESASDQNWRRTTIDLQMADFGSGSVAESIEAAGILAAPLRSAFPGSEEVRKNEAEKYLKARFAATLDSLDLPAPDNSDPTYRLVLRGKDAKSVNTGLDDASVTVHPYMAFENLPIWLLIEPAKDAPARQHDFLLPEAFRWEYIYRIQLPRFFTPGTLPEPVETKIGEISVSETYTLSPGNVLQVHSFIDIGKRRISAADLATLRETISQWDGGKARVLNFAPESNDLIALGHYDQVLKRVNALVEAEPGKSNAAHSALKGASRNRPWPTGPPRSPKGHRT